MTRRNTVLVIVLLVGLTFSACGGKPTPDVQALETQTAARIFATQTASVPTQTHTPRPTATPEATATPQPTVTPRATATPQATATPRATAAPEATATPAVQIPATWKTYEDPTGKFLLRYPPAWEVESQGAGSVTFRMPDHAFVMISVAPFPMPGEVGDDGTINALVESWLNALRSSETARVLAKGQWDSILPCNFVNLIVLDSIDDSFAHEVHIRCQLGPKHALFIGLGQAGTSVTKAAIKDTDLAAASVELH